MPPGQVGHVGERDSCSTKVLIARDLSACHQATRATSALEIPAQQRCSSHATCRHATRPRGPRRRTRFLLNKGAHRARPVGMPPGHAGHVSACHRATRATATRPRGPRRRTRFLLNKGHRAQRVGMPPGRVGHVGERDSCSSSRATCREATGPRGPGNRDSLLNKGTHRARPVGMPPGHAGHVSACHQAAWATSALEIPAQQRCSSRRAMVIPTRHLLPASDVAIAPPARARARRMEEDLRAERGPRSPRHQRLPPAHA